MATLAIALVSSAYTGGLPQIMDKFNISSEIKILNLRDRELFCGLPFAEKFPAA
ncbi:hypothetical protein BJX64DRAFT_294091 [Aspergillus heterothallicus]